MKLRERQELEERRIQDAQLRIVQHNRTPKEVEISSTASLLFLLEPYRDYFIADEKSFKLKTKSSSDEKQLLELVRYLFCKYRVSSQFAKVWFRKIPSKGRQRWGWENATTFSEDPALWFICVAQGGSLYKAYSKKYLTKMETHTLITCPFDLTFEQTLVFAVAKTFALKEGSALRLAHSKLSTLRFTDFLKTVIYFFAKNPPQDLDEVNDLSDFIMARYRESNETWSLAGRTLESLRQKCRDWHFELRRIKVMGDSHWEGAPLPDAMIQTGSDQHPLRWTFTQIKSSKVLAAEGTAMRHCVYGYKSQCTRGDTSIWSLTLDGQRKVTIELSNSGDIVQARGLANRSMRPEERHAVQLWARSNHLFVRV
jgi:hypothetical protein